MTISPPRHSPIRMAKLAGEPSVRKRLFLTLAGLATLMFPALTAMSEDPGTPPSTERELMRDALEDAIEDTLGELLLGRLGRPEPVSPMEGATVSSGPGPIVFEWQVAKRARTYELEIDCSGCEITGQWSIDARGRPWVVVSELDETSYEMVMPATSGTFRWRVRGVRDNRNGDWSAWTTFSVISVYASPQPAMPPGGAPYTSGAASRATPDTAGESEPLSIDISTLAITGRWTSTLGRTYDLAQAGPRFIWSTPDGTETGSAILGTDGRIQVEQWTGAADRVPYQGRIAQVDTRGQATMIEWENDIIFSRYTGSESQKPAASTTTVPPARPAVPAGEGYCCLNGTVYQARDVDCANYGGLFFEDLQAARQACNQ